MDQMSTIVETLVF